MDALGLSGWNIAFQFVNFLIFLYLMYRLLFKPVTEMLRRRRERIGESLREAEDLRSQVEREREEFQSELSDARSEAQRIRDEAARSAEALRTRELERAREEAERLRNDAQAGFFPHLTTGGLFRRLAGLHTTTRKRPVRAASCS